MVVLVVAADKLACKEEGVTEDSATAAKIAKEKDPLLLSIDLVKIK